jgi:tRNA (guanine37-N1)-methyltransferase
VNPRNYTYESHRKVDDVPYGGHPGMLMKAEPVALAIESVIAEWAVEPTPNSDIEPYVPLPGSSRQHLNTAIILTEPSGINFDQSQAKELSKYDQIIFVCGHYEGIDHRVEETFATHVFSIGDYVLTNGELPSLVMADAVVRLLPGVLGNEDSLEEESFENNLLSAPNYTRPEIWREKPIPEVLKSGNHAKIEKWRKQQALERTQQRRPDLIDKKSD